MLFKGTLWESLGSLKGHGGSFMNLLKGAKGVLRFLKEHDMTFNLIFF